MVGDYAGLRCTAKPWLAALDLAGNGQCPGGVREQGLSRMSDHGGQPTAMACMEARSTVESHPTVTRDHHPQGNAETERLMRTLTAECLGRQEWRGPFPLISRPGSGIAEDQEQYLHSALGDKTPRQFARDSHSRHRPPVAAA
jgi:hypothetical protein